MCLSLSGWLLCPASNPSFTIPCLLSFSLISCSLPSPGPEGLSEIQKWVEWHEQDVGEFGDASRGYLCPLSFLRSHLDWNKFVSFNLFRISLRSIREGSRVPPNITVILTVLPGVPGSCREVLGSGSFSCQWTLMSQHSLGKKIPQQWLCRSSHFFLSTSPMWITVCWELSFPIHNANAFPV